MKMYDYQKLAYQAVSKSLEKNGRALMVMATGLGKTIVSAFIAHNELKQGQRGLFICHENDILDQAKKEYRLVLGSKFHSSTFYGNDKDFKADQADILFASFQSFRTWYQAFNRNHFDFIIVDESHHGQAPSYREVINYFKPKKLLGMTATPNRGDGYDIRELFGQEVVEYRLEQAIANSWLTKLDYHILKDNIDKARLKELLSGTLRSTKKIALRQLNDSIFIAQRDKQIAKTILGYCPKKAVIFCENIEHSQNFAQYLPDSLLFHSGQSRKKNKKALINFKTGKNKFILAVNKFNEGIDIPEADLIVFLRNTDSETVFYQQLGRGLRKTADKEKVVVLDFVGNLKRLLMLKDLVKRIHGLSNNKGAGLSDEKFYIQGESYQLHFDDELIDIVNTLRRLYVNHYPSWQEASRKAVSLGANTIETYRKKRSQDLKLPKHPQTFYSNFPGWAQFLQKDRNPYPNWQEAAKAARALGITKQVEYLKRYSEDPRLPGNPYSFYPDFPGLKIFLGTSKKYATWQEASKAARDLKINSLKDYENNFHKDPRLPASLQSYYADYPGLKVFLGKAVAYSTWQEASKASIALGIKTTAQYRKYYKKDPKLPAAPRKFYPDYPGLDIFCGRDKRIIYATWQEAAKAAIGLGIKNQEQYRRRYKEDPRLPADPNQQYKDFPGLELFLRYKKLKK